MPHQCVRCNKIFDDGAKEILTGCDCGSKLFFFIKKEKFEKLKNKESLITLTTSEKQQIENDVNEMLGKSDDADKTVILDLESIRVDKPGKYELDLVKFFKGDPVIFRLEEGKYIIDLAETFNKYNKRGV